MAQNITIAGASYQDVPAVNLPKAGGGEATFVDSSDANATAADIASGQTAYVNGVKLTGTAEVPTHFYPSDYQADGMATSDGRTFYSEVIS